MTDVKNSTNEDDADESLIDDVLYLIFKIIEMKIISCMNASFYRCYNCQIGSQ